MGQDIVRSNTTSRDDNINTELEPQYYRKNFETLITFVKDRYGDILNEEELSFIDDYFDLSHNARCIYVRLLCRRGDWFRKDKINYIEIHDLSNAIEEVINARFFSWISHPQELLVYFDEWQSLFNKQEILTAYPDAELPKSSKRDDVVGRMHQIIGDQPSLIKNLINDGLICVYGEKEISSLLLLFFGNSYQNLTDFVLNDLGIYEYPNYSLTKESRWCHCRQELDDRLKYEEFLSSLPTFSLIEASYLVDIANQLIEYQKIESLRSRVDKLIILIARQMERVHLDVQAISLYQRVNRIPSRERLCRLLVKEFKNSLDDSLALQGNTTSDQENTSIDLFQWLSAIDEKTIHPEEYQFFIQFIPKQKHLKSFKSKIPVWIMEGPTLPCVVRWTLDNVSEEDKSSIERRCLDSILSQDVQENRDELLIPSPTEGFYCENTLIVGIFGLYFWDVIFSDVEGVFFHPFQTRPKDLYSDEFISRRQAIIEERLAHISLEYLLEECCTNFSLYYGLANDLVVWPTLSVEKLRCALSNVPVHHWKIFFSEILRDIRYRRSGLPDLILFNQNSYQLIEVKGPGDQLQKNQKSWFAIFDKYDIPAQVLRVSYRREKP